jgi:SAM-dependent methyltransferase
VGSSSRQAPSLRAMRGYDAESYGEGFADVYDDWYAGLTDVDVTVRTIVGLAGTRGCILELGVGTGRLAVPLAEAGLVVTGIDTSQAMLDRLAGRDPSGLVAVIVGDMVDDLPTGPFDLAFVAYNTIFNLLTEDRQRDCFTAVAARLTPGGTFVVEAFVPDQEVIGGPAVTVRSMAVDHVVLSVSEHRADEQTASGQFVEITEAGGVRLRPWSIRWATPAQLDDMATAAGFEVASRWGDMSGTPFTDDSTHHVTVYRRP